MLARASLIALCAALLAGPALAMDAQGFSCSGPFGADSSEALLKTTFGADNVVTGEVPGPEGTTMLATTVFPNDPAKTLQFGWWDEEKLEGLSYVDLPPGMAGPHGVEIGMTVDEIAAINGQPYTIGGFWWDYGGYAMFETGVLASSDSDCYLSLRFSPADKDFGDIDLGPVSGEVIIPSTDPLLAKLDTRVTMVSVSYPGPEGDD